MILADFYGYACENDRSDYFDELLKISENYEGRRSYGHILRCKLLYYNISDHLKCKLSVKIYTPSYETIKLDAYNLPFLLSFKNVDTSNFTKPTLENILKMAEIKNKESYALNIAKWSINRYDDLYNRACRLYTKIMIKNKKEHILQGWENLELATNSKVPPKTQRITQLFNSIRSFSNYDLLEFALKTISFRIRYMDNHRNREKHNTFYVFHDYYRDKYGGKQDDKNTIRQFLKDDFDPSMFLDKKLLKIQTSCEYYLMEQAYYRRYAQSREILEKIHMFRNEMESNK